MGVSLRYYLFDNEGRIKRIPINTVEKLQRGELALPEYASSTVKLAEVVLILENRKPVDIIRMVGFLIHFDVSGSHKASGDEQARLTEKSIRFFLGNALESEDSSGDGALIPADRLFTEKALNDRFRWEPESEDILKLMEFIWPPEPDEPVKKRPVLRLIKGGRWDEGSRVK